MKEGDGVRDEMESMRNELEGKETDIDYLSQLNGILLTKERIRNDELHRRLLKEIITGFDDLFSKLAFVRVKPTCEVDLKAFRDECKKRYPEDYETKTMEFASSWDVLLRDPEWFPFIVVQDGDNCKEIINEEDEILKELKAKWDEDVYETVVTAVKELNKYNASGGYPVSELWNVKSG